MCVRLIKKTIFETTKGKIFHATYLHKHSEQLWDGRNRKYKRLYIYYDTLAVSTCGGDEKEIEIWSRFSIVYDRKC